MPLVGWHNRTLTFATLFLLTIATLSFAQNSQKVECPTPAQRHFDHVLIVVLENQDYESAIGSDLLKKLSLKGAAFSNFGNLYHSYPNYLAMIAGSDFDTHKRLNSDTQVDFKEDNEHRTIADLLNWRNYAEDYPGLPTDQKPFLDDSKRKTKYARKHVPFLSFQEVQTKSFHNVVAVNTHANDNAFVTDFGSFIADPQKHPLPEYMFYSPNLDDDGHDLVLNPSAGLTKASNWLFTFLTTWLHFDEKEWIPKDDQLKRTLVIVTFDESEGNKKPERLYTVFLGAMVKPGEVTASYNHYSVLHTIECNFGILNPLHEQSGDGTASVITGIWK